MSAFFSIVQSRYTVKTVEAIVGCAVYGNDEPLWVEQALNSILKQTYEDFLLVVVIDGPVSFEIQEVIDVKAQLDERVVVVESKINQGLAACMNFVLDWSLSLKPTYFFRMDADDVSLPNRFQTQIQFLQTHPNVSILGTALIEINEENEKVGSRMMPVSNQQIIRLLPRRCTVNHPTVCIRYEVFLDGYRYNHHLRNTQDYFLWIELAQAGYVFRNLKEQLLMFRRVNDFYKRRGLSKSINEFKARFGAMFKLKRLTLYNLTYAIAVFTLRLLPSKLVKMAYKLDRHLLEKYFKH